MNKGDIVAFVAKEAGLTKSQANRAVDAIFSGIAECLRKGDKVTLVGFGTFDTLKRKARRGRNPKTGEMMNIPAKVMPRFRPSKELRKRVK